MSAALIATQLTDRAARVRSITLDGLDVSSGRGVPYGVMIDTLRVRDAAAGGVSSASFDIDDTTGLVTVATGQFVRIWDIVYDVPVFAGWVESWQVTSTGMGRTISVTCTGIEAVLDWLYCPAVTLPTGTEYNAGVQALCSAAYGIGAPIGWSAENSPYGFIGFTRLSLWTRTTAGSFTSAPGTLRQAVQSWLDYIVGVELGAGALAPGWLLPFTVDFYGNVRVGSVYTDGTVVGQSSSSWRTVTVEPTMAAGTLSPPYATAYGANASGAVRGAYVTGSGGAAAWVGSGTGVPGPSAAVSAPNSATAASIAGAGMTYMGRNGVAVSGRVTVKGAAAAGQAAPFGPQSQYHPWLITLTDPMVGIAAAATFYAVSFDKTWAPSGMETWVISFGAAPASAAEYIRALTRAQQV